MKKTSSKHLSFFKTFEDQESKDLKYGEQIKGCKKNTKKVIYEDPSISKDWNPETD